MGRGSGGSGRVYAAPTWLISQNCRCGGGVHVFCPHLASVSDCVRGPGCAAPTCSICQMVLGGDECCPHLPHPEIVAGPGWFAGPAWPIPVESPRLTCIATREENCSGNFDFAMIRDDLNQDLNVRKTASAPTRYAKEACDALSWPTI
jgi:hypothetical protein